MHAQVAAKAKKLHDQDCKSAALKHKNTLERVPAPLDGFTVHTQNAVQYTIGAGNVEKDKNPAREMRQ
jgi:hypothetical protein